MATKRAIYRAGHLTTRPAENTTAEQPSSGVKPITFDGKQKGLIYVPANYKQHEPTGLALMLHGAGGNAEHGLSLIRHHADNYNIILLSVASQAQSWDVIAGDAFGPDLVLIDQGMSLVFKYFSIDPSRVAIGGFSDGASYALSVGLSNGQLFTHIIAFSPGFFYTVERQGKPGVFISHGIHDHILPVDACSRRIVPKLQASGINVLYKEFNGEHVIPPDISQEAMNWFIMQ
jgi:phospholipase/carboxylesterase